LLELAGVVGEGLEDGGPAVEVDDLGEVLRSQGPGEADRRLLCGFQPRLHARAGVDEQRQRDGQVRAREEGHLLLHAVLEHAEVGSLEIGDVARRTFRHRDVQGDDLDTGAERRLLLRVADETCGRCDRHCRCDPPCRHGFDLSRVSSTAVPRTVKSGRFEVTVIRSGGINRLGLA
jgi:hypothetical protein